MSTNRLWLVLLFASSLFTSVIFVNAGETTFTVSPDGQVVIGTQLTLHCKADEGTTRYEISGSLRSTDSFNEFGGPDNTGYVKTEEWGVGTLTITCAIRHSNNDWNSAERHTKLIQVLPAPAGQQAPKSGGVDFNGYCKHLGYDRFGGNQEDAFSGKCAGGDQEVDLSIADLCTWQYGGTLPYPGLSDIHNMSTWSCNAEPTYVDQPRNNSNTGSGNTSNNSGNSASNDGSNQPILLPSQARQDGTDGGVDISIYCQGRGWGIPNNPSSDADWSCGGHHIDWSVVCIDVWGTSQFHNVNGHDKYGIRCGSGSSISSGNYSGSSNSSSSNNQHAPVERGSGAACQAPEPVSIGSTAKVTPGDANVLRSSPNGEKIGTIPPGGSFTVTGGPNCVNGFRWWQISYNGQSGWTADGDNNTYWIQQISTGPSQSAHQQQNAFFVDHGNGWCSAIPSAADNFGLSMEGHDLPNPRIELHFPPQVDLNGPPEYYVYYQGKSIEKSVVSWTGWRKDENVWVFGISTTWFTENILAYGGEGALALGDVNSWRLDYRCGS